MISKFNLSSSKMFEVRYIWVASRKNLETIEFRKISVQEIPQNSQYFISYLLELAQLSVYSSSKASNFLTSKQMVMVGRSKIAPFDWDRLVCFESYSSNIGQQNKNAKMQSIKNNNQSNELRSLFLVIGCNIFSGFNLPTSNN